MIPEPLLYNISTGYHRFSDLNLDSDEVKPSSRSEREEMRRVTRQLCIMKRDRWWPRKLILLTNQKNTKTKFTASVLYRDQSEVETVRECVDVSITNLYRTQNRPAPVSTPRLASLTDPSELFIAVQTITQAMTQSAQPNPTTELETTSAVNASVDPSALTLMVDGSMVDLSSIVVDTLTHMAHVLTAVAVGYWLNNSGVPLGSITTTRYLPGHRSEYGDVVKPIHADDIARAFENGLPCTVLFFASSHLRAVMERQRAHVQRSPGSLKRC